MTAGAHRFWAITPKNYQNFYTSFSEVEMRDVVGGPTVTGSGVALGPPNDIASNGPEILFDGNQNAVYALGKSTTHDNVKIGYDFGTPVEIVEMAITTTNYGGPATREIYAFWSDDGQSWTMVAPGYSSDNDTPRTVLISGLVPLAGRAIALPPRLSPGWPMSGIRPVVEEMALLYDGLDGGKFSIAGTVAIDDSPDIPVSRKVRLFNKNSGRLVRETSSRADGTYEFHGLKDQKYFLIAHDDTLEYNAAVKDEITPV